jgi:hypothetical protein
MVDDNTARPPNDTSDKNRYAHVLELARAKKSTRGELEADRRPQTPPSNWAPPPGE